MAWVLLTPEAGTDRSRRRRDGKEDRGPKAERGRGLILPIPGKSHVGPPALAGYEDKISELLHQKHDAEKSNKNTTHKIDGLHFIKIECVHLSKDTVLFKRREGKR